jgi:SAM-dependent methyltransferase
MPKQPIPGTGLRRWFVRTFWATHNDTPAIRKALQTLLQELGDGRGLNLGCGDVRMDPRIINLDVRPQGAAEICGNALALPLASGSLQLVISQEVIEHLPDPLGALREMARVLQTGGKVYVQAPFIIGYHPGPEDYWRFSRTGLIHLVELAGLRIKTVGMAVGPGTGAYRVAVEFYAGVFARLHGGLYIPAKALFSVLMYPLKWMDPVLRNGTQADRIAGGYFVIAVKP